MKKLIYSIIVSALLWSCNNQEIDFPDFIYNAVYFPVQYPVRTLSLGNDLIDNTLDKELTFKIGVSIGGMYNNREDWTVDYVIDNSLVSNLKNQANDTLRVLPERYIESISPVGTVVIPSGSFNGWITVKLKDAFLDDPIALSNRYVLPLRITSSSADSILSGWPLVDNPDKRVASDWSPGAQPKDFTLYGIKFVNKIHGTYLHRGIDKVYDEGNVLISTEVFRQTYIVKDQLVRLKSTGRNTAITNFVGSTVSDQGQVGMILTFDSSDNVVVTPAPGLALQASGIGKYIHQVNSSEVWGELKRDALYLEYQFTDTNNRRHEVKDTIVFRDRGIVVELQTVKLLN